MTRSDSGERPSDPRHRAGDPRHRQAAAPTTHRAVRVRPRYGRIALAASALAVVAVAAVGQLTGFQVDAPAQAAGTLVTAQGSLGSDSATRAPGSADAGDESERAEDIAEVVAGRHFEASPSADATDDPEPPADSGEGRRVVFDQSDQQVWLVDDDGTVESTYPVSGSVTDNLQPGTYEVYSRSEHAVGIDDSGTMDWFVRFTHGENAAIGFHSIPEKDGRLVQTVGQLGTPLSHGCIRQQESDAIALWDFAPLGTTVVVTA